MPGSRRGMKRKKMQGNDERLRVRKALGERDVLYLIKVNLINFLYAQRSSAAAGTAVAGVLEHLQSRFSVKAKHISALRSDGEN